MPCVLVDARGLGIDWKLIAVGVLGVRDVIDVIGVRGVIGAREELIRERSIGI